MNDLIANIQKVFFSDLWFTITDEGSTSKRQDEFNSSCLFDAYSNEFVLTQQDCFEGAKRRLYPNASAPPTTSRIS
jgi:hypothetical protein